MAINRRTITTYYWLAKPGIIYGNAITAVAGFLLASKNGFDFGLFIATILGICLVMAMACVVNNYTDRAIDAKMSRTKQRALVTGVVSPKNALIYAALLGVLGFGILALFTNWLTVLIGIIAVIDYVIFYGLAKRKSIHSTLVGTISGAAPPVAGYVAVTNQLDLGALLLFLVLLFWQMAHFYAIAMFRAKDYKAAGIPVLPVVKGAAVTKRLIIVYIVLFTIITTLMPLLGYGGYLFSVVMMAVGLYWLYTALRSFKSSDSVKWAKQVFKSSLIALLVFSVSVSLINVLTW